MASGQPADAPIEKARARELICKQIVYDAPGKNVTIVSSGVKWKVHYCMAWHWNTFHNLLHLHNNKLCVQEIECDIVDSAPPAIVDAAIQDMYFSGYVVPNIEDKDVKLLHAVEVPEDTAALVKLNASSLQSEMHFHLHVLRFARYVEHKCLGDFAMEKIKTCLDSPNSYAWAVLTQEVYVEGTGLVAPVDEQKLEKEAIAGALRHMVTWMGGKDKRFGIFSMGEAPSQDTFSLPLCHGIERSPVCLFSQTMLRRYIGMQ